MLVFISFFFSKGLFSREGGRFDLKGGSVVKGHGLGQCWRRLSG